MVSIDPETANFEKAYLSAGIVGVYIGAIIDQKNLLGVAKYAYFYETDLLTTVKRLICCFLFAVPILSLLLLSKTGHNYWVVILVRTWGTTTLGSMYLFGFSKYIAIKLGLCNTEHVAKSEHDILEFMDGAPRNRISDKVE